MKWMEEDMGDKKRKVDRMDREMEILEAQKRSQTSIQKNHVGMLKRELNLAENELKRMEKHYEDQLKQRVDYRRHHSSKFDKIQNEYDGLLSKRLKLESTAAVQGAAGKSAAPVPARRECVVCLEDILHDVAFQPCGHGQVCRDCGGKIMALEEPCPICRARPTGLLELKLT
jgi:hypothetical protein